MILNNSGRFLSDKGAVVKTNANTEKADEEEKGNSLELYPRGSTVLIDYYKASFLYLTWLGFKGSHSANKCST